MREEGREEGKEGVRERERDGERVKKSDKQNARLIGASRLCIPMARITGYRNRQVHTCRWERV